MLGSYHRRHPTAIQVPPWPLKLPVADSRLLPHLPCSALSSLQFSDDAAEEESPELPLDAYSSDEFRMYEFKVRSCARVRPHDWTDCPCAHPGEKARRRDPRVYHYLGTPCPDFRKGSCGRGDSCMFSHGVFECWLHPTRYRTEPCKEGVACRRKVCFFAHTQAQLRLIPTQQPSSRSPPSPDSYDGSPMRRRCVLEACLPKGFLMSSSPTSTLLPPPSPPSDSPPVSPGGAVRSSGSSVYEVLASLRKLQIRKAKSVPATWGGGPLYDPPMEMDPPEDPDVAWVSDLIS